MFTCPNDELYCAFVDGEVTPLLKEELEEHLSKCEECRRIVNRYRFLKNALVHSKEPNLDLDKSFERLLLKRNSIKKISRNAFLTSVKFKITASAVAGVFLFAFLFILLRHNSSYDKTYTLNKSEVQFIPIVPVPYRQHSNIMTNIDLHDMTSIVKTKKIQTKTPYKNLTNTFNNFNYLYTSLENNSDDFSITMPNTTEYPRSYGIVMPIYTNLNKDVK